MNRTFAASAALALALIGAPAATQPAPAQTLLDRAAAGDGKTVEIQLRADGRLLGVPFELARGTMRAGLRGESYTIDASYRSSGFANDRNDQGDVTVRGAIAGGALRPQSYVSAEKTRKKRRIAINFADRPVSVDVAPRWGQMGNPPASEAMKRASVDPLTGLLELSLVTSRDNGQPCGGTVRIFDGKRIYDISTRFSGRTTVNTPGYSGPAVRCTGRYLAVAGFDEPGARHDLTIWLADVGNQGLSVPVRITGGNAIVSVALSATRVTVSPART